MLAHLLPGLSEAVSLFNLIGYVTVRCAAAMVTGLGLTLAFGNRAIGWLKRRGIVDAPRSALDAADARGRKANMGGLMVVGAVTAATLLWARLDNGHALVALGVMLAMGGVGFLDDYLKIVRRSPRGLVERYKWAGCIAVALALGAFLLLSGPESPTPPGTTNLPLLDEWVLVMSPPIYLAWVVLVLNGATHSVNMTDGLDGLAPGLGAIALGTFACFAYLIGRVDTSAYLGLLYVPGAGELAVFASAVFGALLGFLFFNTQPAQIILGDTGSLALGGALGAIAVLLKAELLLVAVGGVFVAEAASVLIQTNYFRYTRKRYGEGRRVFACAPIHHAFQMRGWANEQVVVRFWIMGALCALVGFATLKLR